MKKYGSIERKQEIITEYVKQILAEQACRTIEIRERATGRFAGDPWTGKIGICRLMNIGSCERSDCQGDAVFW